ncbi:hypothetical protein FPOA_02249 [Fusarium poae]|uniref:Uncharacterized protein n=1 Tax=Fusarium poae TaxID=36050 RepID=A0A1B8B6F3_FUSPO|nr:hypothetical protein FPOA_02249 [Fusarium poae]
MSRHTIPNQLSSEATIRYVGFNETQAAGLWKRWDHMQREPWPGLIYKIEFMDFITRDICSKEDVYIDDDSAWFHCMEHWGIASQMQDAIMDRRFKRLRLTRTCAQWINDTIRLRYRSLEHSMNIHNCEVLRVIAPRPDNSILGIDRNSQHHLASTSCNALSGFSGETLASADNPAVYGNTVLYKTFHARQVCNRSFLDREGNLRLVECLEPNSWIDSNWCNTMSYFTTSLQAAQMYASYMKRRDSGCGEIVVVRLCIPDVAFHNLKGVQLAEAYFPSNDWKKLICHCRMTEPTQLCKFDYATVVIGNVSSKSKPLLDKLDSWEDVTREDVFYTDSHGGEADVQFAFSCNEQGRDFLRTSVTDFKILPYTDAE